MYWNSVVCVEINISLELVAYIWMEQDELKEIKWNENKSTNELFTNIKHTYLSFFGLIMYWEYFFKV